MGDVQADAGAPTPTGVRIPRDVVVGFLAWVVFVGVFGFDLVTQRHFQVDEFQNATNITSLAGLRGEDWATVSAPWQIALGPVVRAAGGSTMAMMTALRLVFGVVAVLNLLLIVWACPRPMGPRGQLVMLWVATLTDVLWRFGFEIRHDALLLTGHLVCLGVTHRALGGTLRGPWPFVAVGFTAALMAMNTIKGVPYAFAYMAIALVVASAGARGRGWRERLVAVGGIGLGAGAAMALVWSLITHSGHVDSYREWLTHGRSIVEGLTHFSALKYLHRAPPVTVLLSLACVAFGVTDAVAYRGRTITPAMLSAVYVVLHVMVLGLNPTPYAYNLLASAGVFLVAAYTGYTRLLAAGLVLPKILAVGLATLLVVDFAFYAARSPYMNTNAEAQASRIEAAEALTGPTDPVLDGVGMVLTRPLPGPDWLLHSSLLEEYGRGHRDTFREYLTGPSPPPVVITNYRWRWLPADERAVLKRRYVRLAKDFYVLGQTVNVSTGGTPFTVRRDGKYLVKRVRGSGALAVDGRVVAWGKPVAFSAGKHTARGFAGKVRYTWVGPRLRALPSFSAGATSALFLPSRDLE